MLDFPDGPVIKSPPANSGDTGLIPGLGRSHMPRGNLACVPQLLSPYSRACAPQQEKPSQWEAHALQLEKALTQHHRPGTVKTKLIKF